MYCINRRHSQNYKHMKKYRILLRGGNKGELYTDALLDKVLTREHHRSSSYIWRRDSESTITFIFFRSSGLLAPTSLSNCSPFLRKKNVGVAFISHCVLKSCNNTKRKKEKKSFISWRGKPTLQCTINNARIQGGNGVKFCV